MRVGRTTTARSRWSADEIIASIIDSFRVLLKARTNCENHKLHIAEQEIVAAQAKLEEVRERARKIKNYSCHPLVDLALQADDEEE